MLVFVHDSVGSCICNDGYVGADCHYREDTRPEDLSLPDGGLCNTRASDCSVISVFGEKFIASSNLTCHLQAVQVISGNTSLNNTDMKHPGQTCPYCWPSCEINPSKHNAIFVALVFYTATRCTYFFLWFPRCAIHSMIW